MARVEGIKKSMVKMGIEEATIREIIGEGNLVRVIERMEKALDADALHQILDSHACGGGKEYIARLKKTGKEIADKTLAEKIAYVNANSPDSETITHNTDGTLSVKWSFDHKGAYKCLCSAAVKKGVRVADLAMENNDIGIMPLSYCYCCAGSGRRHLQLQLGIELKTKEVLSTPIHSKGEKPCEFVLEIV